jgi:hypothetical protein
MHCTAHYLQVWVLGLRFLRAWVRTPVMATTELVQYVLLGIFTGGCHGWCARGRGRGAAERAVMGGCCTHTPMSWRRKRD